MQPRRRINKVFVSSQDYLVTEVRGQSERPEQHFSLIDSLTNQTWTWGELRCVAVQFKVKAHHGNILQMPHPQTWYRLRTAPLLAVGVCVRFHVSLHIVSVRCEAPALHRLRHRVGPATWPDWAGNDMTWMLRSEAPRCFFYCIVSVQNRPVNGGQAFYLFERLRAVGNRTGSPVSGPNLWSRVEAEDHFLFDMSLMSGCILVAHMCDLCAFSSWNHQKWSITFKADLKLKQEGIVRL